MNAPTSGPGSSFAQHWLALANSLGVAAETSHLLLDDLVKRHSEPHRHYHTAEHIESVISRLASLDALTPTAMLSAYFHDAIYDATRTDNEALSARLATDVLGPLDIAEVDDVAAIISATAGHQLPAHGPADAAAFLDADLAILGAPTTVYDAYAVAIRAEYSHLSDADFRSGRAAVLTHFAERETLYFTNAGRERFESPARKNLARELASLTS